MQFKDQSIMPRVAGLSLFALLGCGLASAATVTVNLTAQRASTTLPDGTTVPMWGFCATTTPAAPCSTWSAGPTIVAQPGDELDITLTNNLPTPTSLVILGQIGGNLGTNIPSDPAVVHPSVSTTTFPANAAVAPFIPPTQGARVRAFAPEVAPGTNNSANPYKWTNLKAGTYIYETGTHPSIQAPMGLYGLLIVTTAPVRDPVAGTVTMPGTAYTGVSYEADAAFLFSEIDPVLNGQVDAVAAAAVLASSPIDETKYPPAVNYSPRYFLLNGQAYDKTLANNSLTIPTVSSTGKALLRLANAGLRTHVPAVVGLPLELVAEDGNLAPGAHKLQNEALLTAGKTYDALLTVPASGVFPIFDRQLSLSNGTQPDGGMQGSLAVGNASAQAVAGAHAVDDKFTVGTNATSYAGNVLANDVGIHSAASAYTGPTGGTFSLNANGTFTITVPAATDWSTVAFGYCGNGAASGAQCANVSFLPFGGGPPTALADSFTSANSSTLIQVAHPGVLRHATSPNNLALSAVMDNGLANTCATVNLGADGSVLAAPTAGTAACSFYYFAKDSQGQLSASSAQITLNFPTPTAGLKLTVQDAVADVTGAHQPILDYAWTLEEDRTYQSDPNAAKPGPDPNELSVNFHRSFMPLVAAGCTGDSSCKKAQYIGGTRVTSGVPVSRFEDLKLDSSKRYFLSILPGDAGSGAGNATTPPGHTVGAVSIKPGQTSVLVNLEPQALPTGACVVRVFEDNNPTNGAFDVEPGLGGFQVIMTDARGSTGDAAGQMTYNALGMPLTNALANKMAPDGTNLCPLTDVPPTQYAGTGIADTKMGTVVTCPALDKLGNPSPYAGMAIIDHMMQGRFDVTANPSAELEGRGERWIQTATLEGTRQVECFVQAGDPTASANIGFINPDHINAVNAGLHGTHEVIGKITNQRYDRPPGQAIYDSGGREAQRYSNCEVGLSANGGDGESIAFSDCDKDGNFDLKNVPAGTYGLFVFDQYLDQIINLGQVVTVPPTAKSPINLQNIPVNMWFGRVEHSALYDNNGSLTGIQSLPITVRFRDGSISNRLLTDADGQAPQNETFPLPSWYVAESDTTRFKGTSVVVTNDAGAAADASGAFKGILNSTETYPVPVGLQPPGATYPNGTGSTTRVDPGSTPSEGFQVQTSMTQHIEWHKTQFAPGENGGITGVVTYATTRAFDNPQEAVQATWQALIANIPINLYQKTVNGDGSVSLTLVDQGMTSSWDAGVDAMHCPGQAPASLDPLVSQTLGAMTDADPKRYKCYDGYHNFNQMQPALYDGRYRFPTANCTVCKPNPADATKLMLPAGSYVVEVVPPQGYEILKEEDKNILIGDAYLDPGTGSQFAGAGQIFIVADLATLNAVAGPAKGVKFPACVGQLHRVPDFLSIAPEAQQVAPFAGQDRPLCDRKEVLLAEGMQVPADFSLFTFAPIGGHFTGIMLNDLGAQFSKISPVFGEKAGIPFAPVSFRDFAGYETQRVYTDRWGSFDGMFPTGWEINPPDPSGYSPIMSLVCMNDPGPIPDPSGAVDANGNPIMITDPQYDPNFTNFCFPWGALAGLTTYIDNPVLPAAAFAGGFDPADCAYPDATPAIRRVDGDGAEGQATFGPYIQENGARRLTIKALGTIDVPNPLYGGPNESDARGATKTIKRTYSFGPLPAQVGLRGSDGTLHALTVAPGDWTDAQIVATVPADVASGHYELVITAANGRNSIDSVTVWVGGSPPTYVKPADPAATLTGVGGVLPHPLQDAIDAANPGDLIMLDAGAYHELVLMWKPVRLQGVGAASVVVSGGKKPSRNLQAWQLRVNYLFGLDENGDPIPNATPLVDLLPGETFPLGEPRSILSGGSSILARFEGQTITVLGEKDGRSPISGLACRPNDATICGGTAPFQQGLNPSIDGLTVTAGDGGGGLHVHGWAHGLQIANNRIKGNSGVEGGGIGVGVANLGNPVPVNGRYGYNRDMDIHHNMISSNGTLEANVGQGSVSPGGGLALCTGADNYTVNYNFICGNFSQNDGGGIGHLGINHGGVIANNYVLFNQTYNATWATHGGGIIAMAESGTPLTGIGSNLRIDSNVVLGNYAQAGSGGGIRIQSSNDDVVTIQNNMVTNNIAGWAGGGISLADALRVRIKNNTVASNDTVALLSGLFSTVVNGVSTGPNRSVANPAGISSELTSAALLASLPSNRRGEEQISRPRQFVNNIVWHNRSFMVDQTGGDPVLRPSNKWSDSLPNNQPALLADQTTTGQCTDAAAYWDLGVVGDQNVAGGSQRLAPKFSVLTETLSTVAPYANTNGNNNNNRFTDPGLTTLYCNGARRAPELNSDPNQPNRFLLANVGDEGGNSLDLRFGPLSLLNEMATQTSVAAGGTPVFNGEYHILTAGSAFNNGTDEGAPGYDIDNEIRPQAGAFDIGADEIAISLTPAVGVPPPAVAAFANTRARVQSAPLLFTFTLSNHSRASITLGANPVAVSGPFLLANAGANACRASAKLTPGHSCAIAVQSAPKQKVAAKTPVLTVTTSTGATIRSSTGKTAHNDHNDGGRGR